MKVCNACKRPLPTGPAGAFHRDRNSRDGYKGQCRACRAIERAVYGRRDRSTTFAIDGTFTDGSRCEMTRKSLRLAIEFGAQLYQGSPAAVRVRVRGRVKTFADWNRYPQQEDAA